MACANGQQELRRALPSSRMHSSAGLPDAVRRLRRGLRDVRDRMARRSRRWREVCCAGMAGGDGTALVMVSHEGVDRHEVEDVLRRRWPDVALKESGAGATSRGDVARRCCRSRTVPPRCRAVADRDHAPARSAAPHRSSSRCPLSSDRCGRVPDCLTGLTTLTPRLDRMVSPHAALAYSVIPFSSYV